MLDRVAVFYNEYSDGSGDLCEYNNITHEYHLILFVGDKEYECTWPRRDIETTFAIGPKDEIMAKAMLVKMRERAAQIDIANSSIMFTSEAQTENDWDVTPYGERR